MKRNTRTRVAATIAVATASLVALTGCTLGQSAPQPGGATIGAGALAQAGTLNGVKLAVGGKEFTEQKVLCQLAIQALKSVGAETTDRCGLSGSNTVRQALTSGQVDLYWEYTGTGWVSHLKKTETIKDPAALFDKLAAEDKDAHQVSWIDRAPANNTYAIAAKAAKASELKVSTISDYAALATSNPNQATFCGAAEFFGRDDGWAGLQKAYGFTLPADKRSELALGAIYASIDRSNPCNFGEVFATDGRVKSMGLTVLDDDKAFFPIYNPAISIRTPVLDQHPDLEKILAPVAAALDDETLQTLNASVDVDGKDPAAVAHDWLQQKGFIGR